MIKQIFIVTAFCLCHVAVQAQTLPPTMSYQGYLTDLTGTPVADGNHTATFTLYASEFGGAMLWSETHSSVATTRGLFTVILGRGTPPNPLTLAFDDQYYLGVSIDGDAEMMPRVRLATSAYSFRSGVANAVRDGSVTDASIASGAGISTSKLQSIVLTESEVVGGSGVTVSNAGGTLTITATPGAVTLGGDVTGPAASNLIGTSAVTTAKLADNAVTAPKIADNAVSAAKIQPNIVSSINTVTNDGGNINLVAGANVTITPDDATNTITIAASGGGGGLTLPYSGSATATVNAFSVVQNGTGSAGTFQLNNTGATNAALIANNQSTNTSSTAALFSATAGHAVHAYNNSTTNPTLEVYNNSGGPVAVFGNSATSTGDIVEITKSGGSGRGLDMTYIGTGSAMFIDASTAEPVLDVSQIGTGYAATIHTDNTSSTATALYAYSMSTNPNSNGVYGYSAGGSGVAAGSQSDSKAAIYGYNYNASSSAKILALSPINNWTANVFYVTRAGNVVADGDVTAATHTATTTLNTGTPVAGRTYRDNVVYVWGRITSAGGYSGQSFGISSITRSNVDSSYLITFKTTFSSADDYAVTTTPIALLNPEFAVVTPISANSCKVVIRNFVNGYMRRCYDDFYIIVAGRP